MAKGMDCLRCGGLLERGYVADKAHYSVPDTQQWVEGAPEHSFWQGLKMKDRDVLPVMTYRCKRCGFLESYAPLIEP